MHELFWFAAGAIVSQLAIWFFLVKLIWGSHEPDL